MIKDCDRVEQSIKLRTVPNLFLQTWKFDLFFMNVHILYEYRSAGWRMLCCQAFKSSWFPCSVYTEQRKTLSLIHPEVYIFTSFKFLESLRKVYAFNVVWRVVDSWSLFSYICFDCLVIVWISSWSFFPEIRNQIEFQHI